jgi:hypothetical protein
VIEVLHELRGAPFSSEVLSGTAKEIRFLSGKIGALATAQHSQSRARRGSVIPVLVDSSERRTRRATVE